MQLSLLEALIYILTNSGSVIVYITAKHFVVVAVVVVAECNVVYVVNGVCSLSAWHTVWN